MNMIHKLIQTKCDQLLKLCDSLIHGRITQATYEDKVAKTFTEMEEGIDTFVDNLFNN